MRLTPDQKLLFLMQSKRLPCRRSSVTIRSLPTTKPRQLVLRPTCSGQTGDWGMSRCMIYRSHALWFDLCAVESHHIGIVASELEHPNLSLKALDDKGWGDRPALVELELLDCHRLHVGR